MLTDIKGQRIDVIGRSQHQSKWIDVENKAKRLIAEGKVYLNEKRLWDMEDPDGPVYIEGRVIGDNAGYKCQIWTANSDSRSLFIRSWACQCTWNRYVWNRTRQWRKYEGRICSHILALYWQSRSQPLDEESQKAVDEQKGKYKPQEETLFDKDIFKEIQERPMRDKKREAPDILDLPSELQPNIQPMIEGMEEEPAVVQVFPTGEEIAPSEESGSPPFEALRPLNLDEQAEILRLDRLVAEEEKRERLKNLKEKKKIKSSNLTVVLSSNPNRVKEIAEHIRFELIEGKDVYAHTTKEFWGERRGGFYPHPDAPYIDRMHDGNFVFLPEHLGWDPETMEMGSDKEERGTYGSIPAGSEVQILSIIPKSKRVLISYQTGNYAPNHERIDVWVPLKDIYLI